MGKATFNPRLIMKKCECGNVLFYTDYLSRFGNMTRGNTDTMTALEDMEYMCTSCGRWNKFDFDNPVIK